MHGRMNRGAGALLALRPANFLGLAGVFWGSYQQ